MDFSKNYINMCKQAKEIQKIFFKTTFGQYKKVIPSFVFDKKLDRVCQYIWIPDSFCKNYKIKFEDRFMATLSIELDRKIDLFIPKSNELPEKYLTWLPRQDQLQEMVSQKMFEDTGCDKNISCQLVLEEFISWYENYRINWLEKFDKGSNIQKFPESMEQFWLVFVMYDLYNKIWSKEKGKWIKDEWTKEEIDEAKKKADKLGKKLKWGSHSDCNHIKYIEDNEALFKKDKGE
jgi:hypothetical protein